MAGGTFSSISRALNAIDRDLRNKKRKLDAAVRQTALATRNEVEKNVPKAFGELAESLHVEVWDQKGGQAAVVADAPHAAPVETGSRPHTPPLAPLVAWVMYRGMMGLTAGGSVKKLRAGPLANPAAEDRRYRSAARSEASRAIATTIRRSMSRKSVAAWRGHVARLAAVSHNVRSNFEGLEGVPSEIVGIARAIQQKIAQNGTKPFRYMAAGVPFARSKLDSLVRRALSTEE